MRILVVSDTHGDFYSFKKALDMQKDAEVVIHCGDSKDEIDEIKALYKDKAFFCVKGNCDLGKTLNETEITTLNGKKIFITHGHLYNAKMGLYSLCCAAKEQNANIVLFGHTHNALNERYDDMYLLNPGSLKGYNASFAYIDILDSGVVTNIVKLK